MKKHLTNFAPCALVALVAGVVATPAALLAQDAPVPLEALPPEPPPTPAQEIEPISEPPAPLPVALAPEPAPAPKSVPDKAPAAAPAKAAAAAVAPAPAAAAPARAPSPVVAPAPLKRTRNFAAVSVGGQVFDFDGPNTDGTFLYGATLSAGGFLSKEKTFLKDLLLIGSVGFYFGDWSDTVLSVSGDYIPPSGPSWDMTENTTVSRKSELFNVPVSLTLAYNFKINDDFDVFVGPALGFTFVSMKSKFEGRSETYRPDGSFNGVTDTDSENKSGSKALFTYGLTLGANWNFSERFSLNVNYNWRQNTKLDFGVYRDYGNSMVHQINLGALWRF
jgi:opacity protein-like surface antigen